MEGTVLCTRYEIVSRIGGGGMAEVFVARDLEVPGSRVAVKILNTEHVHKKRSVERFKREANLLLKLQHPNLVRGLDQGTHDGRPFIVMEYIDGPNIEELVRRRGHLSADEALKLLLDIALGLDHLFIRGAVQAHRDIKPTNILVTQGGVAKITDFGIAKAIAESESMTLTSSFLGSPHYMSPEQISDPRAADIRSDIYALGAVFYELLTGEKAFPGISTKEVLDAHFELEAPQIPASSELDILCNEVLARTLAFDVSDRFQTPRELIERIAPMVRADVVVTMPRVSLARLRYAVAIGAGCAILLVALGLGFSATTDPPETMSQESASETTFSAKPAPSAAATVPPSQSAATSVAPPPKPSPPKPSGSAGGVSVSGGAAIIDLNKAVQDATR